MSVRRIIGNNEDYQQPGEQPLEESDPFDLEALRVGQDFDAQSGVKKLLTTVRVGKPNKQAFVRVKPGGEWKLDTAVLELKEDRELYLVAPAMRAVLAGEIVTATLHLAIDRQGDPFLWPVRLPDASGKDNRYWTSARIAVSHCETHWCRVVANQSAGAYDVFRAENAQVFGEPEWPELPFREILRLAFQQQLIDSPEHPVVRRLAGLA